MKASTCSRRMAESATGGTPGAAARAAANADGRSLSANTVSAYVRPLRALAGWLSDEGLLPADPFRRARRWASRNPLLPTEETPTKSATLEDLRALERGCAGKGPLELRDRTIGIEGAEDRHARADVGPARQAGMERPALQPDLGGPN